MGKLTCVDLYLEFNHPHFYVGGVDNLLQTILGQTHKQLEHDPNSPSTPKKQLTENVYKFQIG